MQSDDFIPCGALADISYKVVRIYSGSIYTSLGSEDALFDILVSCKKLSWILVSEILYYFQTSYCGHGHH